MSAGLSVKAAVIGSIATVALISLVLSGAGQYLARMEAGREQIRAINEAVLQPVSELAGRGINGGNRMVLTDAAATGLYKASGVRYLLIEGMSKGSPKTAFTDAIPPQKIVHEFLAEGADAGRFKAAASRPDAGLLEDDFVYVVKTPLAGVDNGGQLTAVFSAEQLAALPMKTLKEVVPLAIAVMVLSLVLAWFIGRRIAQPITRLARCVEGVADSLDLTRRVDMSNAETRLNREAGETARALNGLLEKLRETLAEVLASASQVDQGVEQVSALAGTVASRSQEQSESASRMAAAMEQSTANRGEIANNANYLDQSARESGRVSENGAVIIHKAGDEMTVIASTVEEGAESIEALGRQSDEISAIIQVIKEVADQTNLLALNAAIEAARAGEQGRGFAVVADEVRKLAERTAQSTAQISGMISAIQSSSTTAVGVMHDTVERVGEGVELASQAGSAITQIAQSNQQVMGGVEAISEALRQQDLAYQDIQTHVERIAQMTEENSHAAGESAHAAQDLQRLSRSMREAVSRFRT